MATVKLLPARTVSAPSVKADAACSAAVYVTSSARSKTTTEVTLSVPLPANTHSTVHTSAPGATLTSMTVLPRVRTFTPLSQMYAPDIGYCVTVAVSFALVTVAAHGTCAESASAAV